MVFPPIPAIAIPGGVRCLVCKGDLAYSPTILARFIFGISFFKISITVSSLNYYSSRAMVKLQGCQNTNLVFLVSFVFRLSTAYSGVARAWVEILNRKQAGKEKCRVWWWCFKLKIWESSLELSISKMIMSFDEWHVGVITEGNTQFALWAREQVI